MKKIRNSILKFALIAASTLFATSAQAQYDVETVSVPSIVSAGATSNNVAATIPVLRQSEVALAWTTAATNVTVHIGASVDGSNWQTNWHIWNFTNAMGRWTTVTNLHVGGIGYLRIDAITVTGSIPSTNMVRYGEKPHMD